MEKLQLRIEGTLRIDDNVADILDDLLSYDLLEWFKAKRGGERWQLDRTNAALASIRKDINVIRSSRDIALKAVNDHFIEKAKRSQKTD
jgi:hypothetical protein